MTTFEINKKLLDAVTGKEVDLTLVEELLKLGADPLGSTNEENPDEQDILNELFCEMTSNLALSKMLPKIIQLFVDYGLNISHNRYNLNLLSELRFNSNENGLKALKILLDNGVHYKFVENLVKYIFSDMEMCDGCEIDNRGFLSHTIYSLKMVMCAASYPHIVENSEYIRKYVEIEKNNANNLIYFRCWNDFDYCIDISTCTNIPYGLLNATLTIRKKQTAKIVWTFLI